MAHPIFFSFSGDSKEQAERLKSRFSDDLVYMYSRTGVDGVDFPNEILDEIAQCRVFILFLSRGYVEADPRRPWCRRELLAAAKRITTGNLKSFLIIQVDQTPLTATITDPDTNAITDALKPFREARRAFAYPVDWKSVESRVADELASLSDEVLPELPRPAFEKLLRDCLNLGTYQNRAPLIFVSGFHGSGRRTLVRAVMRSDYRHLTEYTLGIDGTDGPEDLLQLIWGEVLHKPIKEQRALLSAADKNPNLLKGFFQQLGAQLVELRAYLVLAKDDLADVSEVVPYWLSQYMSLIAPTVQPLVFILIPRPLPNGVRTKMPNAQDVHIPTLEDDESERLVKMHISARDPRRLPRWQEHLPYILEAGSNSPKLLVEIVRIASRRPSLDFLKQDTTEHVRRFDERVSQLLDWAWPNIKDQAKHVLLLDILNSLTIAHYDTLSEIFRLKGDEIGDVLYELVQAGIVEHLSESTYRIPPALRRKLNFYLINPEVRSRAADLLKQYGKTVQIGQDEWGGVFLTNRLQIRLTTDAAIADEDLTFVTTAMLFKAGWQKYRQAQYTIALELLRRAFSRVEKIQDDSTKLEILRFYGLAAAREGSDQDMAAACNYLSNPTHFTPRYRERARAIAPFVRGLFYRLNQEVDLACHAFEESLTLLPEGPNTVQQRSMILNELVQSMLKTSAPDYSRAVALAEESCSLRTTPNNLDILLRALLAQTFDDPHITQEQVDRNFVEMDRREAQLKAMCVANNQSFYVARVVDRLEREAVEKVRSEDLPFGSLDLSEPIRLCEEAFNEHQEQALLARKWELMLRNEANRDWGALHRDASAYLESAPSNRMGRGIAARFRILTFDLTDERSKRLADAELEKYRANGSIPRAAAQEIKRRLENPNLATSRL